MAHAYLHGEQTKLKLAILLSGGIAAVEVIGGILSNSLALLSDAWHMFTDIMALTLCLFAGQIAAKPPTLDKTYGYHRVEILSALANGVTLVIIASYIFFEAFRRILTVPEVKTLQMLAIALVGLAANVGSIVILSSDTVSLNVKAALLHVVGDALSSVGVVVAGVIMLFTKWYLVDPIAGVIVGVIIMVGAGRVLKEVLHILLEGTPLKMDLMEVIRTIEGVSGVVDVHDTHVWCITSRMYCLSAHVVLEKRRLQDMSEILNELKEKLEQRYGIRHSTIQLEAEDYEEVGEIHGEAE